MRVHLNKKVINCTTIRNVFELYVMFLTYL